MKASLLLLHGALGSKTQLQALKDSLKDLFDVHTINFEGHGGEASSHDFSINRFTQNVIDYLALHTIDQAMIFGHSMGGYVALNVALQAPNNVSKIYTLGTKFDWNLTSAKKEVQQLNPEIIAEKVPHFAEKLKTAHHPQDWEELMHKTATMMLAMAKGAKLFDDDFKQIQQDVIIGIGSLDHMVTYEESAHVAQLIPNAAVIQLEGVKHPIDKIETDLIKDFILKH